MYFHVVGFHIPGELFLMFMSDSQNYSDTITAKSL